MSVNSGPGPRGTPRTREEAMAAFDSLPPVLRQRLADAAFNFDPVPIFRDIRCGLSAEGIIHRIAVAERRIVNAAATAAREGRNAA